MKNGGQKIVIMIGVMILLGICASFLHERYFNFILSQFKDLNISFQSDSLNDIFKDRMAFIFVLCMLPALFLFAHFILKGQKWTAFLFIVPITVFCGIALMSFHIYSIRTEMAQFAELPFHGIQHSISISKIHPSRYLGAGFIIGTVCTTAILSFVSRDRKS